MTLNKNEKRVLEDILGEERLQKIVEQGMTESRLLNLWHETDTNPSEFKNSVDHALEHDETQNAIEYADMTIDNLLEQIETLQELKEGVLQDKIKEAAESDEEIENE